MDTETLKDQHSHLKALLGAMASQIAQIRGRSDLLDSDLDDVLKPFEKGGLVSHKLGEFEELVNQLDYLAMMGGLFQNHEARRYRTVPEELKDNHQVLGSSNENAHQTVKKTQEMVSQKRIKLRCRTTKNDGDSKFLSSNLRNLSIRRIAVDKLNQGMTVSQVSTLMNIGQKNLRRWKKNGFERKSATSGRKSTDPEMEQQVLAWLFDTYQAGSYIRGAEIRDKAKSLTTVPGFMASKGWLARFSVRNNVKTKYNIVS